MPRPEETREAAAHAAAHAAHDYGPPPYEEDKGDGRRSRRRPENEYHAGPGGPGPEPRAVPAEARGSTPLFGSAASKATRATGVPLHSTHGHGPVWSGAGHGHGSFASYGGMLSGAASGCGGAGLCLAPGSGVGSLGGASGCSAGCREKHVSAGTGGSEEWPSTQARNVRALRESDYEEEKASQAVWAGPVKKKSSRQAPLGNVAPQWRGDADPWQTEAWRGEAPEALPGGLSGLPSIHSWISGPQGPGAERELRGPPERAVREPRGPLHDVRMHQNDGRGTLSGLRRPDLYHGH